MISESIYDYSALHASFAKLSKPAKRALLRNGITKPKDLSVWSRQALADLHGIGPSAMPILESALENSGYAFVSSTEESRK
ncbi:MULTISPECIES: hypothetical protein [Henriciella]|jgi:hypothetical protein|uniref:DNA-binding protein n=1 Tax=Henriciella pelagia TaxID=1977912 RepID=A0ABQ1JTC4_9PROT|nr:hypothetical protein [Henriciella pelagia]GGB77255.1 hypothetical protein GCM10011503_27540 [Henriciella pelagia]